MGKLEKKERRTPPRKVRYFTGKELVDRWGIHPSELSHCMIVGLPPYDPKNLTILCDPEGVHVQVKLASWEHLTKLGHMPKGTHAPKEFKAERLPSASIEWMYFRLFDSVSKAVSKDTILEQHMKALFRADDVLRFEKEYGLCEPEDEDVRLIQEEREEGEGQTLQAKDTLETPSDAGESESIIERLAIGCLVSFSGNKFVLPPKQGSSYIYYLIKRYSENQEALNAEQLETEIRGTTVRDPSWYSEVAALNDGLNIAESFDEPDLDEEGKRKLRGEMEYLKKELAEARKYDDIGRIETIEYKIEELKKSALNMYGYDPKYDSKKDQSSKKRFGSIRKSTHMQKAENRIRKNIKDVLDKLATMPEAKAFFVHMSESIKYGKNPRYAPPKPIRWTVR